MTLNSLHGHRELPGAKANRKRPHSMEHSTLRDGDHLQLINQLLTLFWNPVHGDSVKDFPPVTRQMTYYYIFIRRERASSTVFFSTLNKLNKNKYSLFSWPNKHTDLKRTTQVHAVLFCVYVADPATLPASGDIILLWEQLVQSVMGK